MKKLLVLLLCIVAIPLYTYNILLLTKVVLPWHTAKADKQMQENRHTFEQLLIAAKPPHFVSRGRSPFTLNAKQKIVGKKIPVKAKKRPAPKKTVEPIVRVTGIMWHPENPVAMVKVNNGGTSMVRLGHTFAGGIKVTAIHKKSVTVLVDGKSFTFKK